MAQLASWTLGATLGPGVVKAGRSVAAVIALIAGVQTLEAQEMIIAPNGDDLFNAVQYLGGDAAYPKKRWAVLLLTDSTLSLHDCRDSGCEKREGTIRLKPAWMTIDLRSIKEVASSSQVRGPSTGSRIAFGLLAGDRTEEYVGLVYETASNAEAPVFETAKAHSGALEAKIRFRLKKLGVDLPR